MTRSSLERRKKKSCEATTNRSRKLDQGSRSSWKKVEVVKIDVDVVEVHPKKKHRGEDQWSNFGSVFKTRNRTSANLVRESEKTPEGK